MIPALTPLIRVSLSRTIALVDVGPWGDHPLLGAKNVAWLYHGFALLEPGMLVLMHGSTTRTDAGNLCWISPMPKIGSSGKVD
jgi:hypothetical protein